MRPFRREAGGLVPLISTGAEAGAGPTLRANVDTDQIIPKQFLKRVERTGYGPMLFFDWRFNPDGSEKPDFTLNQAPYRDGRFLVAGRNFGCGSSREHAVWALMDHGFRAVIAPSFADIFKSNAAKMGLLTVELPPEEVEALMRMAVEAPGAEAAVDLESGMVTAGDLQAPFELDGFVRHCLLEGLDDIGLTLQDEDAITEFEAKRPAWMPDLRRAGTRA